MSENFKTLTGRRKINLDGAKDFKVPDPLPSKADFFICTKDQLRKRAGMLKARKKT